MNRLTPRYFAPSRHVSLPLPEARTFRYIVDTFRFEPDEGPEREIVVAVDTEGHIGVLQADDLARLPESVAAQVRFHEMRVGANRTIRARTLHFLEIEHADFPPDVPGVNDPVFVHGRMSGPLTHETLGTSFIVEGHLTVNRADILDAFIKGYEHALHYQSDGYVEAPRCFHLLLPGDRAEAIEEGHGLVLAYPLLPSELRADHGSNDATVMHLVYLVLAAIERELGVPKPTVPYPSRAVIEKVLAAEGFVIEGEVATRRRQGILGTLFKERLAIPEFGDLDDFVEAAARLVRQCERHPTERTHALAARTRTRGTPPPPPSPGVTFVPDPRAPSRPETRLPHAPVARPAKKTRPKTSPDVMTQANAWVAIAFDDPKVQTATGAELAPMLTRAGVPTVEELIALAKTSDEDDDA